MSETKERKMVEIVSRQAADHKKLFYTELCKFRKLINQKWDQKEEDPAWMEIKESWEELQDAYITWQAFLASLDIFHDED